MTNEHGKIQTDGSRSGGQPVTNDKSAVLAELREAIREAGVKRNTPRLYKAVMAFDAALRQPTQSDNGIPITDENPEYTKLLNEVITLRWKCGDQALEIATLRQPTQGDEETPCLKCDAAGDDCGEHAPSWEELAAYWKAEAGRLAAEPPQSGALKKAQDAIIAVRQKSAGTFTEEFTGQRGEDYDKAVLDCHTAVTAALQGKSE